MRAARFVPSYALAAALACGPAVASSDERDAKIDAIFAPWSGPATPGCALAIARDGEPERIRGYGMANLEHSVPVAADSVFHVASISKQFTAFAIALLAQDGKLSLDDDVRKYLPQLPDYGKPITLAHLLHHTNGLREQGQLLNLSGWRGDDLYTQDDMLAALSRQTRTNFDPGEEVLYGNAAYTLLAEVVRNVSGMPLRRFADERIFQPLGMRDTRFQEDHNEVVAHRAQAYAAREGGGWRSSVPNYDHNGSTSLLTTAGDLLKWQRNLIDARVGGAKALAVLRTSGRLNDGTETGYGGGLRLQDYRGLPSVAHDGADAGFRSDAVLFPDHGLAVVALCNGASIAPGELTRKVAELYLGERMTRPAFAPAVRLRRTDPVALAGNYWSALTDEVVRLEFKDGALRQVGTPAAFVPIGEGAFRPGESDHLWRFQSARGGATELSIRDFWPTVRRFARIADPVPQAAALPAFAGLYRSAETATTYEVRVADDGRLRLQWPRGYVVALDAVGGDRFLGSRGTVSFTRDAGGAVDGLTISNRRLRRLQAQRLPAQAANETVAIAARP
ncbi:serine hydrolase [Lysobacter sp. K5869]|uniref:serine hydrolase domain-containing protein n=1 Tax=Lysobacter sp. K5869 TaxID=2820808 RepID=UPI001C0611A2|nr:serine hydrolase domain-containing protein [Lysobacter sp. K5869]QWP77073.1 serine hydrolase [Lysobacter sp. K5869]